MRDRFFIRISAAGLALAALVASSRDAEAQIFPQVGSPIYAPLRNVALRDPKYFQYYINRQDCLDDDVFTFSLSMTGPFPSYQLQVWAGPPGTDCTQPASRTGSAPTCWQLNSAVLALTPSTIKVRAQDIVGHHLPGVASTGATTTTSSGYGVGTQKDCTSTSTQSLQKVVLSFMFVSGDVGTAVPNPAQFNTGYDIWGPDPPTNVDATPGETRLPVTWTASSTTDIVRYDFYCDPPKGTAAPDAGLGTASLLPGFPGLSTFALDSGIAGALGAGGVLTGAGGATGVGGTFTGAGGAGGTLTFDAGAATSTGGTTTVAAKVCNANSALTPGRAVDKSLAAYYCGTIDGPAITSSGIIEGLTNGVQYTVAVVGVDGVLNAGPLSNQDCETPIPVTDFFELYRAAGGKGGGGLCSIARPNPRAGGFALAVGFLAAAFTWVRRARRK